MYSSITYPLLPTGCVVVVVVDSSTVLIGSVVVLTDVVNFSPLIFQEKQKKCKSKIINTVKILAGILVINSQANIINQLLLVQ